MGCLEGSGVPVLYIGRTRLNTNRMGGISRNVWLRDLCAGVSWFRWYHDNPAHSSRNHTLYDIPPIRFVFQVTQKDLRSSLMMAGYCRNM
jgi:hypothetical protein